jgi:hypothetical protein
MGKMNKKASKMYGADMPGQVVGHNAEIYTKQPLEQRNSNGS